MWLINKNKIQIYKDHIQNKVKELLDFTQINIWLRTYILSISKGENVMKQTPTSLHVIFEIYPPQLQD